MQFTQLSDVVTHLLSVEDRGQEVAWRDMNPHVHEEVFHAACFYSEELGCVVYLAVPIKCINETLYQEVI